ncbi:MAG TPA: hypothetical protein VLH56_08475 [Dissulfurispiraceae bacterium]|nr:hypothetical protein [Dissulfurispiraceae bacterium]
MVKKSIVIGDLFQTEYDDDALFEDDVVDSEGWVLIPAGSHRSTQYHHMIRMGRDGVSDEEVPRCGQINSMLGEYLRRDGTVALTGSLLPAVDGVVDLGSSLQGFRDIHVKGRVNTREVQSSSALNLMAVGPQGLAFDGNDSASFGDAVAGTALIINLATGDLWTKGRLTIDGSPAITALSTLVCPNLNADLLDGFHASSFPLAADVLRRDGSQTLTGSLLPATDNTIDLGSAGQRLKDIHLAGRCFGVVETPLPITCGGIIFSPPNPSDVVMNNHSSSHGIFVRSGGTNRFFFGHSTGSNISHTHLNPSATASFDLGVTGTRWRDLFLSGTCFGGLSTSAAITCGGVTFSPPVAANVNLNNTSSTHGIIIQSGGTTHFTFGTADHTTNRNVIPATTGATNLGSTTMRWNAVFTNNFNMAQDFTVSAADRRFIMPADSTGTGPFYIAPDFRQVRGNLMTIDATHLFWSRVIPANSNEPQEFLLTFPSEMLGGTVVINRLVIQGWTGTNDVFLDEQRLRCVTSAGIRVDPFVSTTDFGLGTTGNFTATLTPNITRTGDNIGQLYLFLSWRNQHASATGEVRLYNVLLRYHIT